MGVQRRQGEPDAGRGWLEARSGRRPRQGRQEAKARISDLDQRAASKNPGNRQAGLPEGRLDMELKSKAPSVYFSSDPANPDTAHKFYADIQMYAVGAGAPPDPEGFMRQFLSSEIASKDNKWQRSNATRWRNEGYDNLFHAAEGELDPVKRT